LERITPPFLRFSVITPPPIAMQEGATIDYRLSLLGVPFKWRTLIERYQRGETFTDTQTKGPYQLWRHTHSFEDTPTGTRMLDRVEYKLPLYGLGTLAHALFVRRTLKRVFDFR
jgi:ligand-binding SRPBCC domain-containing protein